MAVLLFFIETSNIVKKEFYKILEVKKQTFEYI